MGELPRSWGLVQLGDLFAFNKVRRYLRLRERVSLHDLTTVDKMDFTPRRRGGFHCNQVIFSYAREARSGGPHYEEEI
jgi:hypothetical protein